jgi:hypothetical protein
MTKDEMVTAAQVLTTVNAPYSKQLEAQELAHCLENPAAARAVPGHMSSFFADVTPELQIAFAALFDITPSELAAAAKAFSDYSGERYPPAA